MERPEWMQGGGDPWYIVVGWMLMGLCAVIAVFALLMALWASLRG